MASISGDRVGLAHPAPAVVRLVVEALDLCPVLQDDLDLVLLVEAGRVLLFIDHLKTSKLVDVFVTEILVAFW